MNVKIIRTTLLLFLLTLCLTVTKAQVFADFETSESTPVLSPDGTEVVNNPDNSGINSSLKSGYYPKPTGNWQYFVMDFPDTIKIANNNNLRFKIKSSTSGRVYVKFWKGSTVLIESWAHEYNSLPASNTWVELEKDMSGFKQEWFTRLEVAAGVDNNAEADVYFDDFLLEKITKPTALYFAVEAGNAFLDTMEEGAGIGQFPNGSKSMVQQSVSYSESILLQQDELNEEIIELTAFNLNDTLTRVESSAIKHGNTLIDSLVTHQTINLYRNLSFIGQKKHQLFGMHDATAYGINEDGSSWNDDGSSSKSDIKVVTGSHGAISSYDASEIISKTYNELQNYRNRLITNYEEGGVNTICWHMDDPKYGAFYWTDISSKGEYNVVASINENGQYHEWYKGQLLKIASFLKGLRGTNGESVPVIFRPFHEHTGSWFWWGESRCSTEEYNELWQFTINYLCDTLNVHNLIYSFSPSAQQLSSNSDYYSIYPGDDYIDVFGLDNYFGGSESELNNMIEGLEYLVENATDKGKIAALTECGNDGISPSDWYTNNLLAAIQANEITSQIAYYATWRNASPEHHYVPYPGHDAVSDFLKFYDDSTTLFLNDVLELYDTLLTGNIRQAGTGSRINSYSFENYEGSKIDDLNITIAMPESADLTRLIAFFELSHGAEATIGSTVQESGITANDFTTPVVYTISSEDGSNTSDYTVTVYYSKLTNIKVTPGLVYVEIGQEYQFLATGTNQLGDEIDVHAEWSVSGGGSIDNSGLFYAETGGMHYVYASSGEFTDSAKVIIPGGTGIDYNLSNNLTIYPNPANNFVFLESHTKIESFRVYNVIGHLYLSEQKLNNEAYSFDVSQWPKGLYVLITNHSNTIVHKTFEVY